jgi:hypothetical protein
MSMPYTVTSDSVGLAIGPVSETANDLHDAPEEGLANVTIVDQAGRKIEGDELLECMTGKKKITEDLRAV